MKKRIMAFACAFALMLSMSLNVFAASANGSEVGNNSPDASLTIGSQTITESDLTAYAADTKVSASVEGVTLSAVSTDTAKAAVAEAKKVVGDNAFIASVVDLNVPEGTGEAEFVLNIASIRKNQSVTILHGKADGTWESIAPSKVEDGAVTFKLTSYSPIAVVVNATAPKTGDLLWLVAVMAAVCLGGAIAFGRKARLN